MKTKPKDATILYAKCAQCSTNTETTKLYMVLEKKICAACGNEEIIKWNEKAMEA